MRGPVVKTVRAVPSLDVLRTNVYSTLPARGKAIVNRGKVCWRRFMRFEQLVRAAFLDTEESVPCHFYKA